MVLFSSSTHISLSHIHALYPGTTGGSDRVIQEFTKEVFNKGLRNGEDREAWAFRYLDTLGRTGRVFRTPGYGLTYISQETGPRPIMTIADFEQFCHTLVEVVVLRETRDHQEVVSPVYLQHSDLAAIFGRHPESSLPILNTSVREPMALIRDDGSVEVTHPGFNGQGGRNVFYYVPPGEQVIEPRHGTEHLERCLSGVPWERPEYRNNFIAWLLGAVVLDQRFDTPFLVVSGNQQGIGKSVSVQAAGIILNGSVPAPINFKGEELMKNVGARFRDNDRLMFLDNIVVKDGMAFDSPDLSTLLTQGFTKRIRVLGHNRSVSASGILFAASVNHACLSTDLATRTLAVKLFREDLGPMIPFCRDYAIAHRREIYGELLGLALLSDLPAFKGGHDDFRFRRWLEFVEPRLTAAFGAAGKLALEEVSLLDASSQDLFKIAASQLGDETETTDFDSDYILKFLVIHQGAYPALFQKICANKNSERGKLTEMGKFLKRQRNLSYSTDDCTLHLVERSPPTSTRGARYAFTKEPIESSV